MDLLTAAQDFHTHPKLWQELVALVAQEPSCCDRKAELLAVQAAASAAAPPSLELPAPRAEQALDLASQKKRCMAWFTWKAEAVAQNLTLVGHSVFLKVQCLFCSV